MRRKSIEEIKRGKCAYDVWRDIERYAVQGYETIEPEDLELFKWFGIYEQRPRRGYFMVRLRLPGGKLNAKQAACIASAGRAFARGTLDITTRQDIQFHWVTLKDIPELFRQLHLASLSTTGSCGDTVRNVVACPLSGRQTGEYINVDSLARQINQRFEGNRRYANLPRKFKISLCGCASQCTVPQLHDLSFYAACKGKGKNSVHGFNVLAGGGLSTYPSEAVPLDLFVREEQVADICEALCRVFSEHGSRKSRGQSRLKFLVKNWTASRLREELSGIVGHDLEPAAEAPLKEGFFREPVHIQRQNQKNLNCVPMAATVGRLTPEDLFVASSVARDFGSGALRLTLMQNVLIPDIPNENLDEACDRLALAPTLHINASSLRIGTLACTGFEFCEKAMVETKQLAASCIDFLEETGVIPAVPIKIAFSGCSNDCGHAQAADIGLRGVQYKDADSYMDYFDMIVGTRLGEKPGKGARLGVRIPAEKVASQVASLVKNFNGNRRGDESFTDFCRRYFTDEGIEFQI
ncbi:MAG: nitrite/sulfite reductase [Acidobacteriota bacterium]